MTIKNALLTSVDLFVDLTTIHLTLYFLYDAGVTQKAGPFKLTDDLLRAVTTAVDERSILKIRNKACRVGISEDELEEVTKISHFLNDTWFTLH